MNSSLPEPYLTLTEQLRSLLDGTRDTIANLANASALLNEALEDINWVGFYLCRGTALSLGPFQGKVACISIPFGRGVCGTAAARDEIQLVPDVHQFPGHIACDCASNSEIVLPLHYSGTVVAVLDIDSPSFDRFQAADLEGLSLCAKLIESACDWPNQIASSICPLSE